MSNITASAAHGPPVRRPGPSEDPLPVLVERLEQLGSRREGRSKWQCPSHNDPNPSLSIGRARNGLDLVFRCHAGCSQNTVREAIGWEWRDFYHPDNRAPYTRDVNLHENYYVTGEYGTRTSSCIGKRPGLAELEDEWRRGERYVVPVPLGEMPEDATDAMRKIAADVSFLLGLFESAGESRPVPYSARFAAGRTGLDKMDACRALQALVKKGVLRYEKLRASERRRPTFAYASPLPVAEFPDAAGAVGVGLDDPVEVSGELAGLDPAVEREDEAAVDDTELV